MSRTHCTCTGGFLAVINRTTGEVVGETACHLCRPADAALVAACRRLEDTSKG